MKQTIIVFLMGMMFLSFSSPEELKWYSWNEGYELAKQEKKPMLVFVHASWCNQCKRLDEKVFNNEEITPLITKDFIPVKFDIEAKEDYLYGEGQVNGRELLSNISKEPIMGIPTTVFWKADGKKVKPVIGLKDPDEMKKILARNRK